MPPRLTQPLQCAQDLKRRHEKKKNKSTSNNATYCTFGTYSILQFFLWPFGFFSFFFSIFFGSFTFVELFFIIFFFFFKGYILVGCFCTITSKRKKKKGLDTLQSTNQGRSTHINYHIPNIFPTKPWDNQIDFILNQCSYPQFPKELI